MSEVRIHRLAQDVLDLWNPTLATNSPNESEPADSDPDVVKLLTAVKNFARGCAGCNEVERIGEEVGSKAATTLQLIIKSDSSGRMACAIVHAVSKWQLSDAGIFIRHAFGTDYPGAEFWAANYLHRTNQKSEAKQIARECLPRTRDNDARSSLQRLIGQGS